MRLNVVNLEFPDSFDPVWASFSNLYTSRLSYVYIGFVTFCEVDSTHTIGHVHVRPALRVLNGGVY
jgi:hypothetical protein